METGPYLTQIIQNKENEQNGQQKFMRCNLPSGKNLTLQAQPHKKAKQSSGLRNKNISNFVADEYYTVKKVKPGISFYKAILQGQERRKNNQNVPELKINLPETLVLLQNSHELIYSERGVVRVQDEIGLGDFMKIVKSQKIGKQQTVKNQDNKESVYCAALTGVGNGIYTDFSIVLSSQLDSRIYPKNQCQICLKFAQPYAQTPNMLRLFYTPKSIKQWKPSYAYKGTNRKRINQQIFSKKHKQLYFYLLDFTKQENIVINTVKGKALEELENMAQSIILYLEFLRNVKIREIVVDFVYASDRKYYFHEIKQIKSTNPSPYMLQNQLQQQQYYKQQTNQIHCKLCQFSFPRSQIKHRVTNKLLLQLYIHLKNRGDTTFSSHTHRSSQENSENDIDLIKNKHNNLTGLSNVCDLCYEIVVAENKLIMLQNVFSTLLSVQPKEIIRIGGRGANKGNTGIGFGVEDTQLCQWRIFFYVQKIKNFPLQEIGFQQTITLNMKFNDFKQTFTKRLNSAQQQARRPKTSPSSRYTPPYLLPNSCLSGPTVKDSKMGYDKKSTLYTNATNRSQTIFLRQNSNVNQNNVVIDFQKIKLITFYTKSQDISQVLFGEDLYFQFWVGGNTGVSNGAGSIHFNGSNSGGSANISGVTNGNSGVKKYKGRSSTLQNFTNKKQCQRHCCEVLLFGNQLQYCNMELSVGLICDGKVSLSELDTKIQKSSKDYLYYSPSQSIRNCSPLPAEWIQIISQGLVLNQYIIQESSSTRQARQTYQSKFSNSRSYQKDNSTLSFGTSLGGNPKRPETAKGLSSNMIKKRKPFFQSNANILTLNNERKSLRNRKVQDIVNIFEDIQSENQEYL